MYIFQKNKPLLCELFAFFTSIKDLKNTIGEKVETEIPFYKEIE